METETFWIWTFLTIFAGGIGLVVGYLMAPRAGARLVRYLWQSFLSPILACLGIFVAVAVVAFFADLATEQTSSLDLARIVTIVTWFIWLPFSILGYLVGARWKGRVE